MANECMNYIKITGRPEEITLFKESYLYYNEERDCYEFNFNYITPIPKDCEDDYSFRIMHWGNKWDGTEAYVDVHDDEVYIDVATAWSPCSPIVDKLIHLCPGLEFDHDYYESGMGFVGYRHHDRYDDPDCDDYAEYCSTGDPFEYWYLMFDKEYENFDWLEEHINDLVEEEELDPDVANEVLNMMNDNTSTLDMIITKCLDTEIL